jgi:putative membrane protein
MKLFPVLIAVASLVAGPAIAQNANKPADATQPAASAATGPAVTDPQQFATAAGVAGLFEIASSKIALTKGQNADVKSFAQKMITDHTMGNEQMATAAKTDGVTPPADVDQPTQAKLDKLNSLSGAEFDKAYGAAQVKGHMDAIALFQGYATNGHAGALKDFAAKSMPMLQEHSGLAQKLPQ